MGVEVTSRKGRVSRNVRTETMHYLNSVTSRKGRVSRNIHINRDGTEGIQSRPARGV